MKYLTDKYPTQEPHFWGHLGRVYSMSEQIPEAIDALDTGISLIEEGDKKDFFILFHIKGMCYRKQAYVIKDNYQNNAFTPKEKIEDFCKYFEKASVEFDNARKYASKFEHGYVSHIQMVLQAIEFLYSLNKNTYGKFSDYLKSKQGEWILTKLNEALEIIDIYSAKVVNKNGSDMPLLKTKIAEYYSNGDMISMWHNLLVHEKDGQRKNYIRRNLVYAYLARREYSWNNLSSKELNNIEKNLLLNLQNYPEKRDVFNWVNAARLVKKGSKEIIRTLEKSLFYNENIDAYFYLYCFYLIDFLNGTESSKQKCANYKMDMESIER